MKRIASAILFSLCATAAVVSPAVAQEQSPETCLRNHRIWSWTLEDPSTVRVSTRDGENFYVRLTGPCPNLANVIWQVEFHTATELGCLRPGDRIVFDPLSGPEETCFIRSVERVTESEEDSPAQGAAN